MSRDRLVNIIVPYGTKVFTKSAPPPLPRPVPLYDCDKNNFGWLAVGSNLFLFVLYSDSDL